MITNQISVKFIAQKLYRDLGINEELPLDDIIEWIGEALLFIGAFNQFEQKVTDLEITNGRVALPCGFYKLSGGPIYNNKMLAYASNSVNAAYFCPDCQTTTCKDCETFYINNNYLFTSFDTGTVCIDYLSIPVDEEGYPKIPDDIYYLEACKMYVVKQLDWKEWRKGRIADKVYQDSEARWNFYVQAARGAANMPGLGELENLKNVMQRLLPLNNEYNNSFRNLNNQERKYIQ